MQKLYNLFRRRKGASVPDSEILTSVLIPSGHHERFILRNEREAFFAPYMEFIGDSLAQVYGIGPIARRQKLDGEGYCSLYVDNPHIRVVYKLSPIEALDRNPSIFYGELQIKQPRINLQSAGRLHTKLLNAHPGQGFSLAYTLGDEAGFQIFHGHEEKVISGGKDLLRLMSVETPQEGLSYVALGNQRYWRKIPTQNTPLNL